MTRDTEKCPLSELTGVRIKRANFGENISAFCRDKRNCPHKAGVRIKRALRENSRNTCSIDIKTKADGFTRKRCLIS